jgi:hypothetical protein
VGIELLVIYVLLGCCVGFLSGLFGIGGGLIIIPILSYAFEFIGFPDEVLMHMAIGTSLSIILVTVISSSYHHYRRGGIDFSIYKKLFVFIAIGSLTGGFLSQYLTAQTLKIIFTAYVVLITIKLFVDRNETAVEKKTPIWLYAIVGYIIGLKSAILGIGGGTISIPFLTWRGVEMKKAVGISAALGVPIALFGSAAYIYTGLSLENQVLPTYSLGYIYIPAFVSVSLFSSFVSKFGAKVSHNLSQRNLKIIFGSFLLLVFIKSLFSFI